MNYIESILKRKSVRTYEKKALSPSHIQKIKDTIMQDYLQETPFNSKSIYSFVENSPKTGDLNVIGSYGFIKNPRAFVVGMSSDDDNSLVDFGYSFEHIILELTKLDIGTCWIGGTFRRSAFDQLIDLPNGYIIPAIISIGYESKKRNIGESILRKTVKANRRKPVKDLFFNETFEKPMEKFSEDDVGRALKCVQLGPSASNKQPWRIVLRENAKAVDFYLDYDASYAGNKLGFKMQYIDIGIAMKHFDLAMKEQGADGKWQFIESNEDSKYKYICTWLNK